MTLGAVSDTYDAQGTITAPPTAPTLPSREEIEHAAQDFRGMRNSFFRSDRTISLNIKHELFEVRLPAHTRRLYSITHIGNRCENRIDGYVQRLIR
jgi:hypothetical protein